MYELSEVQLWLAALRIGGQLRGRKVDACEVVLHDDVTVAIEAFSNEDSVGTAHVSLSAPVKEIDYWAAQTRLLEMFSIRVDQFAAFVSPVDCPNDLLR
jgi:hypothetical protein